MHASTNRSTLSDRVASAIRDLTEIAGIDVRSMAGGFFPLRRREAEQPTTRITGAQLLFTQHLNLHARAVIEVELSTPGGPIDRQAICLHAGRYTMTTVSTSRGLESS
jgi:hypothetical protein